MQQLNNLEDTNEFSRLRLITELIISLSYTNLLLSLIQLKSNDPHIYSWPLIYSTIGAGESFLI